MRGRGYLQLVAFGLAIAAVASDAQAAGANANLVEAKHRYEALEYEKCLAELALATSATQVPSERVDIALYDGLCSFELGKRERAESDFRAALRLDPRATLPPFTSPKIVEVFDATRAKVRAEQPVAPPPSAPAAKPPPPPSAERQPTSHAPPLVSILLGGSALLAAGAGAYLTVHANGLASDANSAHFESDAYALGDRAQGTMTGANIAFGIAGVTAVIAIVYWIVAPR